MRIVSLPLTGGKVLFRAVCLLALVLAGGCGGSRTALMSPAYSISQSQTMLPVLPFNNILVPDTFAEVTTIAHTSTVPEARSSQPSRRASV